MRSVTNRPDPWGSRPSAACAVLHTGAPTARHNVPQAATPRAARRHRGLCIACAYNGTQYIWNYGPDVTVVSTAGALFSLTNFDASESFSFSGMTYTAPSIRVTGTLASGGTVSTTFTMDGIDDGEGPLNDFQTFTLPTTFVGLNKIVFTGVGGSIPYFGIDNIVLSDGNAVPEPASLGLAGLALTLLAGLSVRRSRALQA